jgi:FkbM family methyltransferase
MTIESLLIHAKNQLKSLAAAVLHRRHSKGLENSAVYQRHADDPLVVIDIGCRWGFADQFPLDASDLRVYGFDPDPEECARLQDLYQGKPVRIFPVGLSGKTETRTLHQTHQPACSSLLPPIEDLTRNYPALGCARKISESKVNTVTLSAWALSENVRWADYLKVDTQGSELEILKGGEALIRSARALEIEVEFNPIYQGQPIYSDIDLYLRSLGFVLWKFTNLVHYSKHPELNQAHGIDIVCFDENYHNEQPLYGGQLFWANAHFIHRSVLEDSNPLQRQRDQRLFEILRMPDVLRDRSHHPGTDS